MTDQPSSAARVPSYRLVYSARRTLAITLDERGTLTARAPQGMPIWEIERFLVAKAAWIGERQALLHSRAEKLSRYCLADGGTLPYLGGDLRVARADLPRPERRGDTLYLPNRGDPLRHALQWFFAAAQRELTPRVIDWAKRMGVAPASLSFGHAKARWGSMASTGAMRLNIALLHCPPEQADYVVVHELAHRVHADHSKAFHAYVQSFLPNAAALRAQMKESAPYLALLRTSASQEEP